MKKPIKWGKSYKQRGMVLTVGDAVWGAAFRHPVWIYKYKKKSILKWKIERNLAKLEASRHHYLKLAVVISIKILFFMQLIRDREKVYTIDSNMDSFHWYSPMREQLRRALGMLKAICQPFPSTTWTKFVALCCWGGTSTSTNKVKMVCMWRCQSQWGRFQLGSWLCFWLGRRRGGHELNDISKQYTKTLHYSARIPDIKMSYDSKNLIQVTNFIPMFDSKYVPRMLAPWPLLKWSRIQDVFSMIMQINNLKDILLSNTLSASD